MNNTFSEKFTNKDTAIVGGYNGIVHTLNNTPLYNVKNVSWMQRLGDNILMNNESKSKLYLIESKSGKQIKKLTLTTLNSPVYYYLHNNIVYVACYGDGQGQKSGILTCDEKLENVKEYVIENNEKNHMHCIDLFTYNDINGSKNSFLIAVNLGDQSLYKIEPSNVNFNKKLYEFNKSDELDTNPRHFIQIPNTNKIVVLTEEFNTELTVLEYNSKKDPGDKFTVIETFNLKTINPYITGAEIKYYKDSIYITIRTYISEFTLPSPPAASNGIFAKFSLNNNKLSLLKTVSVGKNPRYFTINENVAYVTNQESKSVMSIDLDKFNILKTFNINNNCAFILF